MMRITKYIYRQNDLKDSNLFNKSITVVLTITLVFCMIVVPPFTLQVWALSHEG